MFTTKKDSVEEPKNLFVPIQPEKKALESGVTEKGAESDIENDAECDESDVTKTKDDESYMSKKKDVNSDESNSDRCKKKKIVGC